MSHNYDVLIKTDRELQVKIKCRLIYVNKVYTLTILVDFVNICADNLCQPQEITR